MLHEANKTSPQHWDIWLKQLLQGAAQPPQSAASSSLAPSAGSVALATNVLSKASFVWPPVGNFAEHVSDNVGGANRQSLWDEPWCTGGSLGTEVGQVRKLCLFDADLTPVTACCPPVVTSVYHWKTMKPPQSLDRSDSVCNSFCEKLGWLSAGEYSGPPLAPVEKQERMAYEERLKKNPSAKPPRPRVQDFLREKPDEKFLAVGASRPSALTHFQRHIAQMPHWSGDNWTVLGTERLSRKNNMWMNIHGMRFFVEYGDPKATYDATPFGLK